MKRISIFLAAMLLTGGAWADGMVYRQGENVLRLLETPCGPPVSETYAGTEGSKTAVAILDGREYKGCWKAIEGVVLIRYEDGDTGRVRIASFVRDTGV